MENGERIDEIVSDMEVDIGEIDAAIKALSKIVTKFGDLDATGEPGAIPYEIAYVISETLEKHCACLQAKWERAFRIMHPQAETAAQSGT